MSASENSVLQQFQIMKSATIISQHSFNSSLELILVCSVKCSGMIEGDVGTHKQAW